MTSHLFCRAALALCAVCLAAPALAEPTSAMVVVRDPTTGQLRAPTADEFKALNAQRANTPALPPQAAITGAPRPLITTGPDGSLRANVGRESLIYAVTQRDAEGKLKMQCVKGQQGAATALSVALPVTAQAEEDHHEQ